MKNFKDIKLHSNATIKEALIAIDKGALKIAVVVDSCEKLIGILTDGDIRRGLLNGLTLTSSIETIIQKNPFVCSINDSKEKILSRVLGKKIYHIPILDTEGKFIGIEDIEALIKSSTKTNKVVLMVGGLGSRLRPLTENTPKPMLKVGNRPILETIIKNFKNYGFEHIILSVNYKAELVKEHFGDGTNFGVKIEYIYEDKRMGTAGALSLMREKFNKPFFVMNGDLLTNVNFEHFLNFHLERDSIATMAVREYEHQVPFGVINQQDGEITSIVEKPKQRYYVNAGIYILSPDILRYIPDDQFYDMPTLFEKLIEKKEHPISFPIHEYWLDIGQIQQLEQARAEYSDIFEENL